MTAKTRKPAQTLHARIDKLEDELKERDARIRELRNDLHKAELLISEERERIEDANALIESWIQAFHMEQDADSKWTFEPWIDELVKDRDAMADKYISLVKKWNANVDDYNRIVRPRNVGRPHPM